MPALAHAAAPAAPWFRNFHNFTTEHGFEPLEIEGRLPPELSGTLYRNGPATFETFGRPFEHWFDGDGALSAVRFQGGTAQGAIRFVESTGRVQEQKKGRPIHGGYGTVPAGNPVSRLTAGFKNVANTSVMVWNDRLLALWEAGLPTELDATTLATKGETDLKVAMKAFSAHPRRVRERRTSYNFGIRYGRVTELDLFELPDAGPARLMATLPLSGATMIHDFIATPQHLIFFAPPLRLRIFRMLLQMGSYSDNLQWTPGVGTEVLVVPIDHPTEVTRFTTDAFYQWHFANAFERGNEIVVDFVHYPDFETNAWASGVMRGDGGSASKGRYARAVLNLPAKTLKTDRLWDVSCEFPRVGAAVIGQPHKFAFVASHSNDAAAHGMSDELAKLDVETGRAERLQLGEAQYPSEPVFVRRGDAGEDDGWLLTLVYDGVRDTSHIAVLDAKHVSDGPIARAHFRHALPFTFHGFWQPNRNDR